MTAKTISTDSQLTRPTPATPIEISRALAAARSAAPDRTEAPWMVALDIDGTIVDFDGEMTRAMRQAINDLVASGAHVVLATGRSLLATRTIIEQLGLTDGWAISSNGAVTTRLDPSLPEGYEISDTITFDPGPALRVLRDELPEALIAIEDVGRGHKLSAPFPPGELTGPVEFVDFEELCATPATRVAIHSPEHSREEFAAAVTRMGLQGVSYAIGWTSWMDINPDGVSKASALEPVRTRLGIPREHTVAAGDGNNDLEMLAWAQVSGAMGQGPAEVHAAADLSLETIDQDGLLPLLAALTK